MADNNSHAKEVAEEEYQPERRQPLDAETLMSETLSTIIQSLPPVDESIEASDREQTHFAQKMPIFQQKNELFVAYMELTEEEIVQLGKAIFDHPQIASVINHINFCGNQFPTERFILFCHLVIAPILYFSGTLALRSSFGFNILQEVAKNDLNEQQKLLVSEIEYGAAFHQNSQTGQLPNAGYSSATAIRNASSGWGTNFGVTGIECDNNGASTDGWKVLVGMLCGDEDVIKEGEKVRKEYLCENIDQTKEGDFYTLIAAARRSLGPSATNLSDDALLPSISDCFSYHLSTLSHLEISENYIHDIGALYGSILLSMAPNLSNVSFVTNQLTSRAMKDFVKAFESRFDALEGISGASIVITAKEAEQLVQKSLLALANHSNEPSDLISSGELKNVLQSIVSATRLVEKESLSIGDRTTTQISPSAYVEYPYCIPQHLVESGYPYSLKQLYLDYNSLGDDGVELLVKTIGYQCPSLVKLGLSDNRIGDKGAIAIAKHIIANPVCRVQHLNLSVNIIGDEGFVAIAKALSCAYVEERKTETEALSSSYELHFKTPVRFDRPAAHYYDVDTEFFIDELEPKIPNGFGSKSAINIKIIDDEKDGEDGLGEGDTYLDNLRFDQTSITLTRTQVDLLLYHTKNENNTMPDQDEKEDKSLQYTINTRLYHLDLANQNNKVQHEGRVAILSLAFAYKYLMSLDVTALDVTNEEMRLLPRAIRLGSQIGRENNSKNESDLDSSTTNLWHFTCGLVNCEWYNNPKIFPQTEELVGRTLETSIERCQIREEVVDKYLKKSNSESENREFTTFLGHLKRLCEEKLYVSKEIPTQNVHVGKTAKINSAQPSSSSSLALTITGLTLVGLAAVVYTKYIKGRRHLN